MDGKISIPAEVIAQINTIMPDTLQSHSILTLAKDGKSYVCPQCGNGTGKKGDGMVPGKSADGAWLYHCFSCGAGFNNIKLLAAHYELDAENDFVEVCKRACANFGIYLPTKEMEPKKLTKPDIIANDLSAPANLENLPQEQRRGLTIDTLKLHHCRYEAKWTTVESRLAGVPNATPTPRLIIPSGNHYLARLLVPVETFKHASDFQYIKDKPHVGTKHPFAIDFISADTTFVIVVEGEIDAMSLNQVFGVEYRVAIATCGAAVGKDIAREIFDKLESFFADADKKPYILILFDNDDTGKRESAKFCAECIKRGYPAVFDFYSDGNEKLDSNNILVRLGDDGLRQATAEIIQRNSSNFEALVKKIAEQKADEAIKPSALFISDEHYHQIFREIAGVNDLANANRFAYILKNLLGDRIRYLSDCDRWANYNGADGTWHTNSNSNNTALNSEVKKAAEILAANAKTSADRAIASAFTHQRKYSPAITAMKYDERITISTEDFDRHKNLLNCPNCVVDLETGKTYQHAPYIDVYGAPTLSERAYFAKVVRADFRGIDYRDPDGVVEKFLHDVQPDKSTLAALLRFFGYAITGECNEEKFLFMDGTGGNGKGTFTGAVMNIVNNYGCAFPIEGILLNSKIDANAATPAFNILLSVRVAMSEEIPPNVKLNPAKIKLLTGRDRIPIRRLHEEYSVIADPTHTMIFSGNNLPEIGDVHDPGILRRLLRIQFKQDFRHNPDLQLKNKLATPECRSALFALLVSNAMQWYRDGLIVSNEMNLAVQNYVASQDFIAEFISEHCNYGKDLRIPRKEFLTALQENYPKETRGLSDRALTSMIEKIDGVSYRIGGKNHTGQFFGIGWKSAPEQQSFNFNDDDNDPPF